eukprot:gene18619-25134_t
MPPRPQSRIGRALRLFALFAAWLALISSAWCKTTLDPAAIYGDIAHAQDCLSMTWNAANQNLRGQTIANCLRMAFHDAGTYQTDTDEGGANGSIMRELDFSIFTQHNGLQACAAIMEVIAVQVRTTGCPELTYADAIQVVGAAAVAATGGPMCDMLMGRPDAAVADDTSVLPSHCHDVTILIDGFTRNGFTDPATSLVVLSGAHNIGRSQVTGQSMCSRGLGPLTAAPNSFDGHFYNEVVDNTGRRGWFDSDDTLADNGAPTATLMTTFARDHGAFLDAWCPHYRESSLLGVDPVANGFILNDGWTPRLHKPCPQRDEGGANGSIMRELDFSIFTQHNGLQACAAIMEVIAVQVRTTGCPELTYADAIQVVGAAAVAATGGPMCDMLMGRPDAAVADDTSVLPSNCHDVTILIDGFHPQWLH